MNVSEKVAYLRGLADGLEISPESKEGKLFEATLDVLEEMAAALSELEENALDLAEEIDVLSDDLADVEKVVFDEDDEDEDYDEDEGGCYGRCCGMNEDDDEYPRMFEVTCPACENTITVDEDVLNLGTIQCPNCGEMLEFDLDSIEEDDEEESGDAE
jgi:transcription elongation factor Elf1